MPSLASDGKTSDPAVKLIKGNIECATCHNPHIQYVDTKAGDFLVRDNLKSTLCLACHETSDRKVNGKDNSLSHWLNAIHQSSNAAVATKAQLGNYSSVAEYGCLSATYRTTQPGPACSARMRIARRVRTTQRKPASSVTTAAANMVPAAS